MNRPNHLSPHLPYAIISYSHYLLLTDDTNDFERKLAVAVLQTINAFLNGFTPFLHLWVPLIGNGVTTNIICCQCIVPALSIRLGFLQRKPADL